MPSRPCDPAREALARQGYLFVDPRSTAAVKPCLWARRALGGGEACYKQQFYGIESHRCVQMTPTLRCNQRCLFCWRSFEHEPVEEVELSPEALFRALPRLQKQALAGYKVQVPPERFEEAAHPRQAAISLAGEPTLYSHLPRLIGLMAGDGMTTFLVTNGTRPWVVARCRPFQTYVSLDAPDGETYRRVCRPADPGSWDLVQESLALLGSRRSAIRVTLVAGLNDHDPAGYGAMVAESAPTFVEVKGYMHLGYSRKRLTAAHMPPHERVRGFAEQVARHAGFRVADENAASRVVLLERGA
ncbi:MAG: 4-demethylwyosine synthase TYW1 [Methanospirillum sp.]|nr:4-demethylwyosine synthase TYW1 [Methanospirillum sp.]